MICIECQKDITNWDPAYIDEAGMPKYYTETKTKHYIERLPLCGPQCSLERFNKLKGQSYENRK